MIAHRFLSPTKGRGSNIPNSVVDTAMFRHADGFGVAWRDPEEGLRYEKFGPKDRAAFRDTLKALDLASDIEYVAHFRFATHGPEDEAHAHPYSYEDPDPEVGTVLVFHNGVIASVNPTKLESDTEVFVRDWLAKLPSRWWENAGIRKFVDHMGGWSRLVLMTKDETINLNWHDGEEDGGLWYSSDHRPYKVTPRQYPGLVAYGDTWDDDGDVWAAAATTATAKAEDPDILDTTNPSRNDDNWTHSGHDLHPLQSFDFTTDGDYPTSVVCNQCGTAGDVYVVDGKAYVDIPHSWNVKDGDDEPKGKIEIVIEQEGGLISDFLLPERATSLVGSSGSDYGKARLN
jgi:hypothetical protein